MSCDLRVTRVCACWNMRAVECMQSESCDFSNEPSNELFRFSTTEQKWEQLNATRVSGSPPSPRYGHRMVAVGNDLYVFGGDAQSTSGYGLPAGGNARRCDAGSRLGACQIERRRCSARCLLPLMCSSGRTCRAAPKSGDSGRHITPLLAP